MYIEIRVQWTINLGSSHMHVHAVTRVHAVTPKLVICVMYLTSIWRILLMTDGLNAVWSNDRAAHTDTNPKNLELAPPQSITATRLDQLVYSPNYYIQIFQTRGACLFFVCCSDSEWVCGNVCCVAAVVKVCYFSLNVVRYVVCLCKVCDGWWAFCLNCEAWSYWCSCMGSMSVVMQMVYASVLCLVTLLNAAFCMTCVCLCWSRMQGTTIWERYTSEPV